MKITDAFLGEHGVFYAQFDWIEQQLERNPTLDGVHMAAHLLGSALIPHAQMENELLFEHVEAFEGKGAGPTAVMREEHDVIERLLERSARAGDLRSAILELRSAIADAREHFLKEEQVAFPLAERVLGAKRLEQLGEEWANRRAVVIA